MPLPCIARRHTQSAHRRVIVMISKVRLWFMEETSADLMTKMKTLAVLKLNDSNHLEFAGALISTMLGKREILPIIMPTGKNTGSIGNKTTSTVQSLTVAAEAEHS
ncbi:uncharacterized protein UV8b_04028 [Ustilaginoidea virens]|uniref:Uncharacterized protein n=1 Tax=Ustilaginoidea virens TaxID=1159556 RepID=A0A8E5MHB2_USTVR|nr:uncharacterized protein UV8b_04028 [Ustilaginoidea virens]QUC19787.1 hypothetical protein UV8b_04028 [Ustilaginoidea virens]